mmetsp:Transcript_49551/g.132593  ORF Transcript_49551/g.132593 Transcript_49551/m.132593 type:complete len:341 (+) Transcript_49551:840-1862(+)
MLCEQERERQVGIPEDEGVRDRVDELQAVKPANREQPRLVRGRVRCGVLLAGHRHASLINQLLHRLRAVVLRHHVPQVLVAQAAQDLVIHAVQLPAVLEGRHCVDVAARPHLGLGLPDEPVGDLLADGLALAPTVRGHPVRLLDGLDVLHLCALHDIARSHVAVELPFIQELLFDWLHLRLCRPVVQLPPLRGSVGARIALLGEEALQREVALDRLAHVLRHLFQCQVVLPLGQAEIVVIGRRVLLCASLLVNPELLLGRLLGLVALLQASSLWSIAVPEAVSGALVLELLREAVVRWRRLLVERGVLVLGGVALLRLGLLLPVGTLYGLLLLPAARRPG